MLKKIYTTFRSKRLIVQISAFTLLLLCIHSSEIVYQQDSFSNFLKGFAGSNFIGEDSRMLLLDGYSSASPNDFIDSIKINVESNNRISNTKAFNFNRKTIKGDLIDSSDNQGELFNLRFFKLNNSKFTGKILLSNKIFNGETHINRTIVHKNIEFKNCIFTKKFIFERTFLGANTIINLFTHNLDERVKDNCTVSFDGSTFKEGASFNKSLMSDRLSFVNANFIVKPNFDGVILPKVLDFEDASFQYLNTSGVDSKIDFRRSYFFNFKSYALTNIDRNRIALIGASLTNGNQNKCRINLKGTDASRFILPYSMFNLEFDEYTRYEEKISVYEAVISTCKSAGMTESAQNWDIDYRKLQINNDWPILRKYIINFNDYWWNFGYEKWRILVIWLPLLFLSFFIINCFIIEKLYHNVYQDKEIGKEFAIQENEKPVLTKFWYRISYSFFYTAVIYFGLKLRHEAVNYKNFGGLVYLYIMYIVGAIHVAFALSYILSAY